MLQLDNASIIYSIHIYVLYKRNVCIALLIFIFGCVTDVCKSGVSVLLGTIPRVVVLDVCTEFSISL